MDSEQVSFKSFAETGQRLSDPDIGRELVDPSWSRDQAGADSLKLSHRLLMLYSYLYLRPDYISYSLQTHVGDDVT